MNINQECRLLLETKGITVTKKNVLRRRRSHVVYRIHTKNNSYILKCFQTQLIAKEISVYRLLQEYGVPTLPCYGMTDKAIVLEDLEASKNWFLACESDMSLISTGVAVANWYRNLHQIGFEIVGNSTRNLQDVHPWVCDITSKALFRVGKKYHLSNLPVWDEMLKNYELLIREYQSCPQTFNYSDFAMENLALSSLRDNKRRAIVFDYDNFSVGTVYSDWQNVVYSLQGKAIDAFKEAYGEVQEKEQRLDDFLGILYGLIVASNRDTFPSWALPLLKSFENGDFERKMEIALEIV